MIRSPQLQSDDDNRIIFAYATDADHKKIEQMIGKLDGSGREIHVIWLRRLPARQVAGTLMTLLVGEEEKEEEQPSGRRFFFDMPKPKKKKEVSFRVVPDVERNRLLLWANSDEVAEVRRMLVQLGESPEGRSNNPSKVRVLRARSPEETARLLERLKSAYPGKLNIEAENLQQEETPPKPAAPREDTVTRRSPLGSARLLMTQLESDEGSSEQPEAAPEVNIVVTDDGRIVLSSNDPAALNDLEALVAELEPPKREFHHYALKHAVAEDVVDKLEEYFADELKDQTESVFDEWGEYEGEKEKKLGRDTLGRRELMRFVADGYTNSVIVQGASPSQLAAIEQMIKIYDQSPKSEINYYKRKTEVISLKYSRAQDIARSLKEVYRELLSSKDKEFQDKEGNLPLSGRKYYYSFGEVKRNARGDEDPVLIAFEGALSIGVDEVSNTLIISARQGIIDSIKETVQVLDRAATPDTMVHVHRVRGVLSADRMQKTLKGSLAEPWPGGKPPTGYRWFQKR